MTSAFITNKLIAKIALTFIATLLIVGITYVGITIYLSNKYFEESTQKINSELANHLIEEKFQNDQPFTEDGEINKALFGDIMHDMMAVNRGIEVYLVSLKGEVLYSVVLDHSDESKPAEVIDTTPIREFIENEGENYILGDDPRNKGKKKIFSAAQFNIEGNEGFIYIILAGKPFEEVTESLLGSYFIQLGIGASTLALLFSIVLGILTLLYITKHLREIIYTFKRFKEGDYEVRIQNASKSDLAVLAMTFNNMADTIVRNIDDLKSVESLRRELIANVSHDLRTPLAIMQGYVETLQIKKDKLSQEERDKYVDILEKSIGKLSYLINQLFEYSKLEAKQIEPQKEAFSISDLAYDISEKYAQISEKKAIKLNLEIEENLPLVFADISLVERVIQNLMDNALKFTPSNGEITIELNSDKKSVWVYVKDTGKGIPENEVSHVFDRFKRLESGKKAGNGAGLGLAIAKKIVEIHNSTINVISKPNQGTTFSFYLQTV